MSSTDRLHALDAVRAYALLLGLVLHTAAAYLEGFPMPMWNLEPNTASAVIYYVIHMFRMTAFFLIAGFFARMVVERRGVKTFVKDRLKRIALPLFIGGPIVIVLIGVGFMLGALAHGTDYLMSLAQQPPPPGANPALATSINLAHLWFLYYLLIFYALVLVIRGVVHGLDRQRSIAALLDHVVALVMRGVWAPVVIALPLMAYFLLDQDWNEWIGLPAPFFLTPDVGALVGYGVPFTLGWLLHRQIHLLMDLHKSWLVYLVAAIALTVVCLSISGTTPRWGGSTLAGTDRTLYTLSYMTGIWCWTFALVGGTVKFLSDPHPVNRYLADASYWIYLMHMATIVFFLTLVRPWGLPWTIEFFIMVGGSMPILLVTYHYLVRFTWIGAILNGRRHPRPDKPKPAAEPASAAG